MSHSHAINRIQEQAENTSKIIVMRDDQENWKEVSRSAVTSSREAARSSPAPIMSNLCQAFGKALIAPLENVEEDRVWNGKPDGSARNNKAIAKVPAGRLRFVIIGS